MMHNPSEEMCPDYKKKHSEGRNVVCIQHGGVTKEVEIGKGYSVFSSQVREVIQNSERTEDAIQRAYGWLLSGECKTTQVRIDFDLERTSDE